MPSPKKRFFFAYFKPRQNAGGFSLVEIVLSMFVILAIVSILFTVAGTYNISRKSSLQGIAAEIADREIETLRNTSYSAIDLGTSSFADSNLSKLSGGTASQTVTAYQSSADIKQVSIHISWNENGVGKSFSIDTLIYKNGI